MGPVRALIIAAALTIILASPVTSQERVAFEGTPVRKLESHFHAQLAGELGADDVFEYQVRIIERNGKWFWASRGMKEMRRSTSGAYVTYHAVDGSGYVRVMDDVLLAMKASLPPEYQDDDAEYVEHMTVQLGAITYWGFRKVAR